MNRRRQLLKQVQDRIDHADARAIRLAELLRCTGFYDAVSLALKTAQESAVAWRTLRGTLVQTFKLMKERRGR